MDAGESELDEWNKAANAGARARRKALVPKLVAAAAFVLVFGGTFLGLGSMWGDAEQREAKELAERGYVKVYRNQAKHDAGSGVFLFLVAGGAALGAAAIGFFATGGKLSAEHARGFREISR